MTDAFRPVALRAAAALGFDPARLGLCIAMLAVLGAALRAVTVCVLLGSSRHLQGKPPLCAAALPCAVPCSICCRSRRYGAASKAGSRPRRAAA